jgi:hypothetical protein
MLITFFKTIWLKNKSKPTLVFITNSSSCPCAVTLRMADGVKIGNIFHLKSILPDVCPSNLFTNLNAAKRILIYAHGDGKRLECFYKDKSTGTEYKRYIPADWWTNLKPQKKPLIYFHVCYGAKILSNSNVLNGKFEQWVSYKAPVMNFNSVNTTVNQLNQKLLERTVNCVSNSNNPKALKAGLESVYKSIESEVHNLKHNSIPGYHQIITAIGNNVKSLQHSP